MNAIKLLKNYFSERTQMVRIDDHFSSSQPIDLGVPQGSVLGPLLFIIFIDDIVFYCNNFITKLFADDTTLLKIGNCFNELVENFKNSLVQLLKWCSMNRLGINWSKTKIMVITNKKNIQIPDFIEAENNRIDVVDNFRILGLILDNKLTFLKHVGELKLTINKRLYSIERLFYLSKPVKVQFMKTFILPHFDYCLSLIIYYPKKTIQKLANYYNYCLYKLLNIRHKVYDSNDFNSLNNLLNNFKLDCFQHRIIKRLSSFIYKVLNYKESPKQLRSYLYQNVSLAKPYNLRNKFDYVLPLKGNFNDKMEETFQHFFPKFMNCFLKEDLNLKFRLYTIRINNNVNRIFLEFLNKFQRFDLNYKNFCY